VQKKQTQHLAELGYAKPGIVSQFGAVLQVFATQFKYLGPTALVHRSLGLPMQH
jgi:hypothetical protein